MKLDEFANETDTRGRLISKVAERNLLSQADRRK
jgi:hypothetical protein